MCRRTAGRGSAEQPAPASMRCFSIVRCFFYLFCHEYSILPALCIWICFKADRNLTPPRCLWPLLGFRTGKDLIYPISNASLLLLETQNASQQQGRLEFFSEKQEYKKSQKIWLYKAILMSFLEAIKLQPLFWNRRITLPNWLWSEPYNTR